MPKTGLLKYRLRRSRTNQSDCRAPRKAGMCWVTHRQRRLWPIIKRKIMSKKSNTIKAKLMSRSLTTKSARSKPMRTVKMPTTAR